MASGALGKRPAKGAGGRPPRKARRKSASAGRDARQSGLRESATLAAEVRDAVGRPVCVLTCDGRVLVGVLTAYDPLLNIVLSRCHERVFSAQRPVQAVQLGSAYLVRGDNVAVLGAIDVSLDAAAHYERVCALPLSRVTH